MTTLIIAAVICCVICFLVGWVLGVRHGGNYVIQEAKRLKDKDGSNPNLLYYERGIIQAKEQFKKVIDKKILELKALRRDSLRSHQYSTQPDTKMLYAGESTSYGVAIHMVEDLLSLTEIPTDDGKEPI